MSEQDAQYITEKLDLLIYLFKLFPLNENVLIVVFEGTPGPEDIYAVSEFATAVHFLRAFQKVFWVKNHL